jgi:hypothetical protein
MCLTWCCPVRSGLRLLQSLQAPVHGRSGPRPLSRPLRSSADPVLGDMLLGHSAVLSLYGAKPLRRLVSVGPLDHFGAWCPRSSASAFPAGLGWWLFGCSGALPLSFAAFNCAPPLVLEAQRRSTTASSALGSSCALLFRRFGPSCARPLCLAALSHMLSFQNSKLCGSATGYFGAWPPRCSALNSPSSAWLLALGARLRWRSAVTALGHGCSAAWRSALPSAWTLALGALRRSSSPVPVLGFSSPLPPRRSRLTFIP